MSNTPSITTRHGLWALSPMVLLIALFVGLSVYFRDFYKVPLLIIFIVTSGYALYTLRGRSLEQRLSIFSRGAGDPTLLLMVWIFVLAGAFASSAKAMGSIDTTVSLTLMLMPQSMILAGIFAASCFVSLSIGTSVGTVVAIIPVAAGLSAHTGLSLPLIVASAVGGAFFGDNLSFISDTTVVATKTQGCRMRDKFRTNLLIALPAALLSLFIYIMMGLGSDATVQVGGIDFWKVVPYLFVLIAAIAGMNVLLVLLIGIVLTGVVGIADGAYDLAGWLVSLSQGIEGMAELILISMMAGGLLSIIRTNGGISWLLHLMTSGVHGRRGAELSIAGLVVLTNLCTANNTVAILSVGSLARDIAERYGVDPRKSASLLDTFSCCIQGVIPYGAQLLMASGLAAISPTSIIPYLFYPFLLCLSALVAILVGFPKFRAAKACAGA